MLPTFKLMLKLQKRDPQSEEDPDHPDHQPEGDHPDGSRVPTSARGENRSQQKPPRAEWPRQTPRQGS